MWFFIFLNQWFYFRVKYVFGPLTFSEFWNQSISKYVNLVILIKFC